MARVLGESGRYVSQEATRHLHRMWVWGIFGVMGIGAIGGFVVRGSFPWVRLSNVEGGLITLVALLALGLIALVLFRRLDELERKRGNLLSGARGEKYVGAVLSRLPESYCVINDLATPTGNLDHVVVGPTGVFIIETKNWRGVIGHDGKGELTQDGRGSSTRHIARFVGRMMGVRERVGTLAPGVDVFYQAVMVFASARVKASFGSTGNVHCLEDRRLLEYILEERGRRKLSPEEVNLLARAFGSLARMEDGFDGAESGGTEARGRGFVEAGVMGV